VRLFPRRRLGRTRHAIDDPNAKPGPDLNWEAFLGDMPKRPFDVSRFFRWRMYEDYAGGPSTDLFPHSLTPVLYILGVKMPSMVVATGGKYRYQEREIPDTFNTLIDYPEASRSRSSDAGQRLPGYRWSRGTRSVPVIRGWDGTLTIQGKEIVFVPRRIKEEAATIRHRARRGHDTVLARLSGLLPVR